jgi:hypothetical protein
MYKITDILSLGSEYTIADPQGNFIGTIQIIPFDDILSATLGPYTFETDSYQKYIDESMAVLSGFEEVDSNRVLWYATSDDEVVLADVIQFALNNGYDKIILEHLEETDA